MKRKAKKRSKFDRLSDAEKEAPYLRMERIRADDGEPLNEADRRNHRKAGLRVGRPRIGKGAKRINISMERDLLKTADRFARRQGITRARLIAESVRAFLSSAA